VLAGRLRRILPHRGERWQVIPRLGNVIEADDADVVRNPEPAFGSARITPSAIVSLPQKMAVSSDR